MITYLKDCLLERYRKSIKRIITLIKASLSVLHKIVINEKLHKRLFIVVVDLIYINKVVYTSFNVKVRSSNSVDNIYDYINQFLEEFLKNFEQFYIVRKLRNVTKFNQ